MAIKNITVSFFLFFLLVSVAAAAYLQQLVILSIPFILLLVLWLVQNPVSLYYLLLASIPWSVEFNFQSGLGTDLPDEPLMLLTSFSILAWLIYKRNQFQSHRFHPILVILTLQFCWTLLTVVNSIDVILSVKYLLAKSWYLLAFLAAPLVLFRNEILLKRGAIVLMCSMLAFMFLALARHTVNGLSFETINDSLKPFYRNHVNYSALLVFTVPIQLAACRLATSKKIRALLYLALLLTAVAVYFSFARGAWVALLAGWAGYRMLRKRVLLAGFILVVLLAALSIFYISQNDRYLRFSPDYKSTIFHTDFREHLVATYQMKDVSTAERFYRWVAGFRMVKDSWMTGLGPSTFYPEYKAYALPAFKTWVSRNTERSTVHNYFLLLVIEQGILGLLFFLFLLGLAFWKVQQVYHGTQNKFWKVVVSTAATILVMECVINFLSDMIETDKAGSIFYLCLAVIVLADWRRKEEDGEKIEVEAKVKG